MRRSILGPALFLCLVGLAPATVTDAEAGRAPRQVRFKWRAGAVGSNRLSITGPRGSMTKAKTRERAFARTRRASAGGREGTLRFAPYGASQATISRSDGITVELVGNAEHGSVIGNSIFSSGTRVRLTAPGGAVAERDFTGPGHRKRAVRAANRALETGKLKPR